MSLIIDGVVASPSVFAYSAGGVEFLRLKNDTQDSLIVNEAGVDIDFRVEAVGAANALFVQGSSGSVGLGTAAPAFTLDISGGDGNAIRVQSSDANSVVNFIMKNDVQDWRFRCNGTQGDRFDIRDVTNSKVPFVIESGSPTSAFHMDSSGNVGFNQASPSARLDIVVADTGNVPCLELNQNDTTNNPTAATIVNAGTGSSLFLDMNGATGNALEVDQDSNDAGDVYAMKIVSDNAGAGLPGGIDFSSFTAAEPIFNVPVDTTAEGAYYGRIAVNVTGVGIRYVSLQAA